MVRNIKEVLKELGWTSGFHIPVANEENKKYEKEVEQKLKKKANLLINVEDLQNRVSSLTDHLSRINEEKDHNQLLITTFNKELDSEMTMLKNMKTELSINSNNIKNANKEIEKLNERDTKLKEELTNLRDEYEKLKDTINWGEEELFAWEEDLARGERDFSILEKYQLEDSEKFYELEAKRQSMVKEYLEAKGLETREADRIQTLEFQLDHTCKMFRELHDERQKLLDTWEGTIKNLKRKDDTTQTLLEEIANVQNQGRRRYVELCEKKEFYTEQEELKDKLKAEIEECRARTINARQESSELEKEVDDLKAEVSVTRRTLAELGSKINSRRTKNSETSNAIKAKITEQEILQAEVLDLRQKLSSLDVENMTVEQRCKNAEEVYNLGLKTKQRGATELDRMQEVLFRLRKEVNILKEKELLLHKEISILKNERVGTERQIADMKKEADVLDNKLFDLELEYNQHLRKLEDITDKTIDVSKKHWLETKIVETEKKLQEETKEFNLLQTQIKASRNEISDLNLAIKHGKTELDEIESEIKELKIMVNGAIKGVNIAQNTYNQSLLQLSLVKMQVDCTQNNISKDENFVCKLERQRIQFEAAMNERMVEIEGKKQMLFGKKKTLLEEWSTLKKANDSLSANIRKLQKKFEITMDMLGKDEDGQQLTITQLKIKAAQEKHELQEMGDELEARLNKTEKEIEAMENTLKLVNAVNDNYKHSLERIDENSPEMKKYNQLEEEFVHIAGQLKEKQLLLKTTNKKIKAAERNIEELYEEEEIVKKEWKEKDNEAAELEKDLSSKQMRLSRATNHLAKLIRDVKVMKEPPTFRENALKDINNRLKNELVQSALQQLAEIAATYIEAGPVIKAYLSERGLSLPPSRMQSLTPSLTNLSLLSPSNASVDDASSRSSEGSRTPSLITMDPLMIPRKSSKDSLPERKTSPKDEGKKK